MLLIECAEVVPTSIKHMIKGHELFLKQSYAVILVSLMMSISISMSSCGRATATPAALLTVDNFIKAMRETGVELRAGDEEGPTVLGLAPQSVRLGDEQLFIYDSIETLDPLQVLGQLEQDLGPRYLWVGEHLLVLYEGNDGGTVLLVESVLGDPAIGPPTPGDEPYPPAIPAALQIVAAELGAQPAEVEVLAYEMVEWSDACMEFEQTDEVCADVITPGWRIHLRLGTLAIEAHTDMLGMIIRWRSD